MYNTPAIVPFMPDFMMLKGSIAGSNSDMTPSRGTPIKIGVSSTLKDIEPISQPITPTTIDIERLAIFGNLLSLINLNSTPPVSTKAPVAIICISMPIAPPPKENARPWINDTITVTIIPAIGP